MNKYYVVSPNVNKESDYSQYLNQMFEEHTTLMGWGPDNQRCGKMFDNMQIGDYVICARGNNMNKKVYFAGRVASENTKDWPYTRKLSEFVDLRKEKITFSNENAQGSANLIPAIYELKPHDNEADKKICEFIKHRIDKTIEMKELDKIRDLALSKKNIILQGAPGTGKTYTTAELALRICDVDTSLYNTREDIMKKFNQLVEERQIAFVTFHQTMDYDDFIEGLKPQPAGDKMSYDVEDGIFKKICSDARIKDKSNFDDCFDKFLKQIESYDYYPIESSGGTKFHVSVNSKQNLTLYTGHEKNMNGVLTRENIRKEYFGQGSAYWGCYKKGVLNELRNKYGLGEPQQSQKKNYVLIIDEINRGNISKIFGELITLLEADKRDGEQNCIPVKLAYSKDDFTVPSNLYIIGTMNTTDRSVGSVDYAIRRRFAFYTLESSWKIAEATYTDNVLRDEAKSLYEAVEKYIKETSIDMDFEDLMVGHSYFMYNEKEPLSQKWEYEILPLLNEYYKDGICSKGALDGIKNKVDKKFYMQKFIEKYK